uniref:LAGLIDADG endonuclease n=1 Tax=Trametes versicolor TaxID=5325 RepID=A0A7S8WVA0_TRAVE|nr:LAGLIDADG endonuclease [Trametes versicolor]QPF23616.1 LAGLIDADG endonuclease [Trametes versicolor]
MFISRAQLVSSLKGATGVLGGVGLHHYGSLYLSRNEIKAENIEQDIRDNKINQMSENVVDVKDSVKSIESNLSNLISKLEAKSEENISVNQETLQEIQSNVDIISKTGKTINEQIKDLGNKELGENISDMINAGQKLQDLIDSIVRGGKNFVSDFNFQVYYDYLNSLTQIQEGSLIHILLFLTIFFSILNILAALLGNELIQYFNLEKKYPRLALFFRLRVKFQRYYLLWNIFYIILVCIVSVGFNLLILFYS